MLTLLLTRITWSFRGGGPGTASRLTIFIPIFNSKHSSQGDFWCWFTLDVYHYMVKNDSS